MPETQQPLPKTYEAAVLEALSNLAAAFVQLGVALTNVAPTLKALLSNIALPGVAETDWLGAPAVLTHTQQAPCFLIVYVCVSVPGIFRIARTNGPAFETEDTNSGNNLNANAGYAFTIPWVVGDSINFRYSATGGTIRKLIVMEMGGTT